MYVLCLKAPFLFSPAQKIFLVVVNKNNWKYFLLFLQSFLFLQGIVTNLWKVNKRNIHGFLTRGIFLVSNLILTYYYSCKKCLGFYFLNVFILWYPWAICIFEPFVKCRLSQNITQYPKNRIRAQILLNANYELIALSTEP